MTPKQSEKWALERFKDEYGYFGKYPPCPADDEYASWVAFLTAVKLLMPVVEAGQELLRIVDLYNMDQSEETFASVQRWDAIHRKALRDAGLEKGGE